MYEEPTSAEELMARYKAIRQRTNPTRQPVVARELVTPKRKELMSDLKVDDRPPPTTEPVFVGRPSLKRELVYSTDGVPTVIRPPNTRPRKMMDEILMATADKHGLSCKDLLGHFRHHHIVAARREACYAILVYSLRNGTPYSLSQVGDYLGRDHSTVVYLIGSVVTELEQDAIVRARWGISAEGARLNRAALKWYFPKTVEGYQSSAQRKRERAQALKQRKKEQTNGN